MKDHESGCRAAMMVLRVPLINKAETNVLQSLPAQYLFTHFCSAFQQSVWPAYILQLIIVKYFPLSFKVNYTNWNELNPCCDSASIGTILIKARLLNKQMLDSSLLIWLWRRMSLGRTKQSIWTSQGKHITMHFIDGTFVYWNFNCQVHYIVCVWEHVRVCE